MITGQLQIEVEAKPEIVFDLLADPTKVSAWVPKITEMSLIPEGPIRKGSKGGSSFKYGRKRMEYEFICYEYDRPKIFSIGFTGKSDISNIRYEFVPTEKGTEINYRFEVKFQGLWRFLEPFFKLKLFKRLIIKQEQKELEAFKDYITKNK